MNSPQPTVVSSGQPTGQPAERKLEVAASRLRASWVAWLYALAAWLWFAFSDEIVLRLFAPGAEAATRAQLQRIWATYEVWLFVILSAFVLWAERAWHDQRVREADARLRERVQERTDELGRVRAQLQIILDNAPVAFSMRSIDNRYMLTNRRWEELAGVSSAQALGKTPYDVFPAPIAEQLTLALHNIWEKRAGILEEFPMSLQGKDYVFLRASFPLFDDEGTPYAAIGLVTDITESKATEESLRQAEERFRAIFQSVGVGIKVVSPSGHYLSTNPAFQRMLGYTEEELMGKHFSEVTYLPDVVQIERIFHGVSARPHEMVEAEKRYVRADGSLVWAHLLTAAVTNSDGTLVNYVTVVEEITARKEAEAQRQRTQAELEQVVAARTVELQRTADELAEAQRLAHVGNWNIDLATNRLEWSAETYRIFGYAPNVFQGSRQTFLASIHPDDLALAERVRQAALELDGAPMDYEHRVVRPNGEIRVVHERGYVVRDKVGKPVRIFGTVQDITERKQAEEEIRAINTRLSAILQASPLGIIVLDMNRIVRLWNPAAEQIYGYPADEVLGIEIPDLQADDDPDYLPTRERVFAGERLDGVEAKRKRRNGSIVDVSISTAPLRDEEGKLMGTIALIRDISERVRASQALRASEERFARIFYSSPYPTAYGGIVDGVLQDVNDRFAEFFLSTREVMIGRSLRDFARWVWRKEQMTLYHALMQEGRMLDYEVRLHLNDGSERDILLSMYRLNFGGNEVTIGMFTDITARKQVEAEVRRLNEELEGRVAERTLHLQQEIAERVRAEQAIKELNATLAQQAEHLVTVNKELETFTYSVSHDLKAPLRGIDGYSRLLQEDYADRLGEEGHYFLRTIRGATTQMAQLIDDLLSYSRLERRTLAANQVDVREVVERILFQMHPTQLYPQSVVEATVASQVVNTDADALTLVLRNLIDNALKFSANAPAPKVEIVGEAGAESYRLRVRDNGVGFDMQYQERIFDIFQRLHRTEEYPGTGIGLAMVRKALQRMHGRVWVESQPGQGATFTIEIPVDQVAARFTEELAENRAESFG
jgi:PAS domain S-box-containing protein